MITLIRSLLYSLFQLFTTILFALLAILSLPFPFPWRYAVISQWARLNLWALKLLCGLSYTVEGKENIPEKPCIIMCKHQSAWETLALQAVFPQQVWVLKRELLWLPFFGWGLAALNPIAIDRKAGRKALKQIIEQGRKRLSAGSFVVIFPEGTRIEPGKMGRFGIGGAKLAAETNTPVVPVTHNAGKFWPKKAWIKRPGTIRMRIGTVIDVHDKTPDEINRQVYRWMEHHLSELDK